MRVGPASAQDAQDLAARDRNLGVTSRAHAAVHDAVVERPDALLTHRHAPIVGHRRRPGWHIRVFCSIEPATQPPRGRCRHADAAGCVW